MSVLCRWGHADVAEALLFQDECPSWLYEVDHGATTIWESWANIAPDGTVGTYSFNHYSFGCVADWFVKYVAGLAPFSIGYREFSVQPKPLSNLSFCRTSLESPFGRIRIDWERLEDGRLRVEAEVPNGTLAHAKLPSWETVRLLEPGTYVLFG
jgi:alpha-L-rhamnosidase